MRVRLHTLNHTLVCYLNPTLGWKLTRLLFCFSFFLMIFIMYRLPWNEKREEKQARKNGVSEWITSFFRQRSPIAFTMKLNILGEQCILSSSPWTSMQPNLGTTWSPSHLFYYSLSNFSVFVVKRDINRSAMPERAAMLAGERLTERIREGEGERRFWWWSYDALRGAQD